MEQSQAEWAEEHLKPEDQMACRNCGNIVHRAWIIDKLDHKGLCSPCLNEEDENN